jgi:hypothetical protein
VWRAYDSTFQALGHPNGGIVAIDVAGRGGSRVRRPLLSTSVFVRCLFVTSLQVILKDSVGITSFGTVSCLPIWTRTFLLCRATLSPRTRAAGRLQQRPPLRHAGAVLFALTPRKINLDLLQVMWEQTPTQYDIVIRNVSAAGAVVYNGSASGNNMIGLKLRFP